MKYSLVYFFSLLVFLLQGQERKEISVQKVLKLMGTRFEITVVAPNEEIGYINIDEAVSEIRRIERMISSWDEDSETSAINKNAGIRPVKVSPELFQLITRANKIAEITDGAFDISYAALDGLWRFDGSMEGFPSDETINKAAGKVDYRKIVLDEEEQSVFLKEKGMRIGFGAIGKGYAADKAKALLIAKGVRGGIVNASGDLTTWGTKVTGEKWMVGITDPLNKKRVFSWLPVVESSVATSGNYEKYIVYQGDRYSHIIDPRTGYPAKGVNSVSIFAKQAELCDALATAVFIMGRDSGIHMINQLDGVEIVLVDSANKIHKSSGIILDVN
ncbi:MAG: FAD:protein FMN transferase [Bacteroidota bacterium]